MGLTQAVEPGGGDFLTSSKPHPVAGPSAVMAQQSLNMVRGAPNTLGPGILVALSPNINLSTNMASEAISEHLLFLGSMPPDPPSISTHHHRCPPNLKYLPTPRLKIGWVLIS